MILSIKTDSPEATIAISDGSNVIAIKTWFAHRQLAETIQLEIDSLLNGNGVSLDQLKGIVCFEGPGSFTGLRIGAALANSLAYGLGIPVAGGKGDNWLKQGSKKLGDSQHEAWVVPDYGAPVHTTLPRK